MIAYGILPKYVETSSVIPFKTAFRLRNMNEPSAALHIVLVIVNVTWNK